jgi:hypothetical protein
MKKFTFSSLEPLEPRIAPAGLNVAANGLSATYDDVDGDHITIKTSAGDLHEATFTAFAGTTLGNFQLAKIEISGFTDFNGANITITSKKAGGGDGLVAVGEIIANGVNLGKVTVAGDLGAIQAGTGPGVALGSLDVQSMGRYGFRTQSSGGGSGTIESDIHGSMGAFNVKRDVSGIFLNVSNGSDATLGPVTIGGSLVGSSDQHGGEIFSDSDMGAVKIGRDLQGGSGENAGLISCGGVLGPVTVGGSLIGGTDSQTGSIFSAGTIGAIKIGHDVLGGSGAESGYVEATGGDIESIKVGGSLTGGVAGESGCFVAGGGSVIGTIGRVTIAHDIKGGAGMISGFIVVSGGLGDVTIGGSIVGGTNSESGGISTGGGIGNVKIGHNLIGSDAENTGFIESSRSIASVTINGSIIGGSATDSGEIATFGAVGEENNIGKIKIGHDLIGGSISGSDASISRSGFIRSDGAIAGIKIGGSIISGIDDSSSGSLDSDASIRAAYDIQSFKVKGSLIGHHTANGDSWVILSARGQDDVPTNPTSDRAFGNISVGGRVEWSEFLGGYDTALDALDGNAQIGKVKVGGDWIASSLVAGAENSGGITHFGDGNDSIIGGLPSIAKISGITIGGNIIGDATSTNGTEHFGFVSKGLFPLQFNGESTPLAISSTPLSPLTDDVTIVRF